MIPTVSIQGPHSLATVTVELARTREELSRGLMHRAYLAPNAGMLFVMGSEAPWAFWMRNTHLPLDILYITDDWVVAGIVHNAEPCTDTLRDTGVHSSYVLEVNGGWTAAHQIDIGAKVYLGQIPSS
jgi:uncharacterized membrane protein (UPF0127 family)